MRACLTVLSLIFLAAGGPAHLRLGKEGCLAGLLVLHQHTFIKPRILAGCSDLKAEREHIKQSWYNSK